MLCAAMMIPLFPESGAALDVRSEVRGLWVARESIIGLAEVRDLVAWADTHHYTVLFVQVRGRGDAFYRSALAPGPEEYPNIPGSFDPLAAIIPLAHSRGIEVHAWFNLGLTWSLRTSPTDRRHVLRSHPEWFMTSLSGMSMATCPLDSVINADCEGRYLSPGIPEVREHLVRVILEAAERYRFDGIHLDYVRYPGWNYDFRSDLRADFRRKNGMDPVATVTGSGRADPNLVMLDRWVAARAGLVSDLVRGISLKVRAKDARIRVSAAVKPDPEEAYFRYAQDWTAWVREGIVDFVVPMSYHARTDEYRDAYGTILARVDRRKIIGGIGVYMISPETAEEQAAVTRDLGLLGYCAFSYGACREDPKREAGMQRLVRAGRVSLPPDFKPYLRREP